MKTKAKGPHVRWVKVERAPGGRWHTVLDGSTITSHPMAFMAKLTASLFNGKLSRRVAARERKWGRTLCALVESQSARRGALISAMGQAVDALDRGDAKAARRLLVAGLKGR